MPHDRFYHPHPLLDGHTYIIEGSEEEHMTKVMRVRQNEVIEVINGQGTLAEAFVKEIQKKKVIIQITSSKTTPRDEKTIILAQGFLRSSKLEIILQKCTELGVNTFWIFEAEGSETSDISPSKHDRLQTIIIGAMKQSGVLYMPEIHFFKGIEKLPSPSGLYLLGSLSSSMKNINELKDEVHANQTICYFIGPEKGFTEDEEALIQHKFHAKPFHMNSHILRAETAAIAAASILSYVKSS